MTVAEFYKNEWRGGFDGSDEELVALLSRSEIIVDNAVMMSGVAVASAPDTLKKPLYMAVCAQADFIDSMGGVAALSESGNGSVSLGRFSYSGGTDSGASTACSICEQARQILELTGLLYKGVNAW